MGRNRLLGDRWILAVGRSRFSGASISQLDSCVAGALTGQGLSIVIAMAVGPKQSQEGKVGLLRFARKDTGENRKVLLT